MENVKLIQKILIANRGEIARRIIRTARHMGIATVAIYAESDINAPFVHEADMAIALKGESPGETYLDTEQVLAACKTSGADALHPGYGFLSENTEFAKIIEDHGITFIGPSVDAIDKMGDKLSAKKIMIDAGVPTLPAMELSADGDISAAAEEIGYPVLVKATAGGGGRGMRVVASADQLADAVASAKREAGAAFGNDTVFLERWLTASRHVEIQILGDQQGNIVHCFERECSIQRRHQKIIEEAPSPAMTPELRQAMGAAAVSAARSIGYYSTGTVEFLLDGDEFWFLEVNTRLQVEHPVTEEITGLDLVREQIRIAEGASLTFVQSDLHINGHAIEARLYAENPEKNFLPSPGTVVAWQPSASGHARYDSGIESGSTISTQFDPMIAKVIVHAATRQEAIKRLARALETTRLQGLVTNRAFLVATLRTAEFLAGDTTTDFIDRVNPPGASVASMDQLIFAAIASIIEARAQRHSAAKVLKSIPRGWRNSHLPPNRVSFKHAENTLLLEYRTPRHGGLEVRCQDQVYATRILAAGNGQDDCEINSIRMSFRIDQYQDQWLVHGPEGDIELTEMPRFPRQNLTELSGGLTAPMPGKVLAINIGDGDQVSKGQVLLVLEAMKMEHQISAPRDGTVTSVNVSEGDQVANSELLIELAEEA